MRRSSARRSSTPPTSTWRCRRTTWKSSRTHATKCTSLDSHRVRGAQTDLASTAAFLAGIVAQETIKVLTVQYIPLDNTCVYDGVSQAIGSIRL